MGYFKLTIAIWVVLITTMLFVNGKAQAADMQVVSYNDTYAIVISGDFVSGDADQFSELLSGAPEVTTVLLGNSDGGLIEQYDIALTVYDNGLDTVVLAGSECVSYCALIYEAGNDKLMEPGSTLFFHSVYIPADYMVSLIEGGYCYEEIIDEVYTEVCGQPYTTEDIVVGLEDANRETLRDMIEFMFYIDMDPQLILNILDYGAYDFHVVTAN